MSSVRSLSKAGVARTIGILPLFEYKLRLARWRETLRLHGREVELAAEIAKNQTPPPYADVATIVPTFKRPQLLGLAVESALAQTVTDHQILVIDDGGGLGPIPSDSRVTTVQLGENIGIAGVVRNIAIRLTNSRVIAFLDDDNTWEPNHLKVALAQHAQGADLTYSGLRRVGPDGGVIDVLSEPFSRSEMKSRSLVDTNVIVVRRGDSTYFSRVPRRGTEFPGEDWEFVWRLSRRMNVVHIPEVTVAYLRHEGSNYSNWSSFGSDPDPS